MSSASVSGRLRAERLAAACQADPHYLEKRKAALKAKRAEVRARREEWSRVPIKPATNGNT